MRAFVDPMLCVCCGLCAQIAPGVFFIGKNNVAEVRADTTEQNRAAVSDAIDCCPVSAISER